MAKDKESTDTYVIPPNFIEGGTFFGGLLKVRNTIEAGIIAVAVSLPVFQLPLDLQMKLIILCVTALPLTILTLIGVMGESLSSFLLHFFRYLKYRRVLGDQELADPVTSIAPIRWLKAKRELAAARWTGHLGKKV